MLWVTIFNHTSGFTKDAFLWGACPPKNEGGRRFTSNVGGQAGGQYIYGNRLGLQKISMHISIKSVSVTVGNM